VFGRERRCCCDRCRNGNGCLSFVLLGRCILDWGFGVPLLLVRGRYRLLLDRDTRRGLRRPLGMMVRVDRGRKYMGEGYEVIARVAKI
jgi:hypothetical protein